MALMKKNMVRMLISVAILFVLVFGYKAMHALFHYRYLSSHRSQVIDVSVITAAYTKWQPQLEVVGSVRAQLGINVTTELAGMIRTIYFSPGAMVAKGDLLVELNIDPDIAKLHQLEASATLADIIYRRDKAQYAIAAISKATLDTDEANLKNADAMVAQQTAVIAQKTIRAPFSGRLGICVVNPGQYLNPGDKVTSLQVWDPIYVDFYVPQQWINRIKVGQQVQVKMTTGSRQSFAGKITTIDAAFDPSVRNIQVEATLANPTLKLAPGMFAVVTINTGAVTNRLTLPQTAISFNPYGSTVYLVREVKDTRLTVKQAFVKTGETRGDQIEILSGVKVGDRVVTSGQLKLQNGSNIAINNKVTPMNEMAPHPIDE